MPRYQTSQDYEFRFFIFLPWTVLGTGSKRMVRPRQAGGDPWWKRRKTTYQSLPTCCWILAPKGFNITNTTLHRLSLVYPYIRFLASRICAQEMHPSSKPDRLGGWRIPQVILNCEVIYQDAAERVTSHIAG
jgi:hypothetical protein